MKWQGWRAAARFGLPGVILGLAVGGGWGTAETPSARAQALGGERSKGVGPGDSSGTIAFTTATGGSAQLLYLIDTKTRAFAIYRVDPANPKGAVKLEAARQYQWDLKLSEYNNSPPEVAAIESSVAH